MQLSNDLQTITHFILNNAISMMKNEKQLPTLKAFDDKLLINFVWPKEGIP